MKTKTKSKTKISKEAKKKIDAYVKKYARDRKISILEAKQHEIVKNVIALYVMQDQRKSNERKNEKC